MPRGVRVWACIVATAAIGVCVVPAAQASFPGTNGKIAFSQEDSVRTINPNGTGEQVFLADPPRRNEASWSPDGKRVVYRKGVTGQQPELAVVNADGTNDHLITNNSYPEWNPQWSADGTKITFWADPVPTGGEFSDDIFVVDAAGGPVTPLTTTGINRYPVWSPDGTKIMWQGTGGLNEIWTMNADGSGKTNLTQTPDFAEFQPDWSPDGSRIAFSGGDFQGNINDLRVMNADGTNRQVIADPPNTIWAVQWSPDGTKIAYNSGIDLYIINPDGTGNTLVRPGSAGVAVISDWIPVPVNGYPRPQGATPLRVSLVPAYTQCTSANRVHGPPLDSGSCNPPVARSDEATVGTPDSNGETSNAQGSVRYETLVGNPSTPADEADVRISVSLTDIYDSVATFPDYAGELRAITSLRITDKLNHPYPGGPQAGTVTDTVLGVTVPCTPTPDPGVGATCAVSTTMDALVPGAVPEGRRAIWRQGQVQVDDGGADGDADTTGDNTVFMTQGMFIP